MTLEDLAAPVAPVADVPAAPFSVTVAGASTVRLSVVERIVAYNVLSRYYGREKKGGIGATKIMDRLYDILRIEDAEEAIRSDRNAETAANLQRQRAANDFLAGKIEVAPEPPKRRTVAEQWGPENEYRIPPKIFSAVQTALEHEPEPGDIGWRQFASLARRFGVIKPDATLD